jgi:hypothetical protein
MAALRTQEFRFNRSNDWKSEMRNASANQQGQSTAARLDTCSKSIDWYTEGEARTVDFNGVQVTVRFVGRKGRRGRIAITGPTGAVFRAIESREPNHDSSAS